MAVQEPIIKNITDFTSSNIEEIKKKLIMAILQQLRTCIN